MDISVVVVMHFILLQGLTVLMSNRVVAMQISQKQQ